MMQYFTLKESFQPFAILLLDTLADLKVTLVVGKGHRQAGEIFQRIKELAAKPEDQGSIPETHLYMQKISRCNFIKRGRRGGACARVMCIPTESTT